MSKMHITLSPEHEHPRLTYKVDLLDEEHIPVESFWRVGKLRSVRARTYRRGS